MLFLNRKIGKFLESFQKMEKTRKWVFLTSLAEQLIRKALEFCIGFPVISSLFNKIDSNASNEERNSYR